MSRMWKVGLAGVLLLGGCKDSTAPPVDTAPLASSTGSRTVTSDTTKKLPSAGSNIEPSGYIVSW